MGKTAISIQHISKKYLVGKQKDGSLRGTLSNLFRSSQKQTEEFYALQDVSFEVKEGDVVGIIGKNGAGKSTLLKILSQITKPSAGRIELNGRVASLLEVGTGFHPELTGRENIYLNGTILGMTRKEVAKKLDEIVAFSGVEKFIDTPVKHYSSGMYVRLAFAVAAHLEPEILIIDEVLAVGDAEFQKKCLGKMKDVAGQGRTVLFVSHDLGAVKQLCTKGVLLEQGRVIENDIIDLTLDKYLTTSLAQSDYFNSDFDLAQYSIRKIHLKNNEGGSQSVFSINEKIVIDFDFNVPQEEDSFSVFINIKTLQGTKVFALEKPLEKSKYSLVINNRCLTRGSYVLDVFIHIPRQFQIFAVKDICLFEVYDHESELTVHGQYDYGVVFGDYEWI